MNKTLWLTSGILLSCLSPAWGSPDSRLVGRVSSGQQPLADAIITLLGDPVAISTTSDSSGAFELSVPRGGFYQLQVTHRGHEPFQQRVALLPGLTTPVTVALTPALAPQPRTRLGILGVATLPPTQALSQRLASESLRLQAIPPQDTVLLINNQRLQPILQKIGIPLYELFDRERLLPEAVGLFFDYLGLQALVVARVDVLRQPGPTETRLSSRSSLELWSFNPAGELSVRILDQASQSQVESGSLTPAEIEQLYQIQTTRMMEEIAQRWQQQNPLAPWFDRSTSPLSPQRTDLDTQVELVLPRSSRPGE
ncbi:MAG: carboxypeptidase-like regulatory domain-containing protein [Thermostichales cyanobacterium SZTDM-1c_bins_54]